MIKRLTTAEEVTQLLSFQDNVEEIFPCTKGEWVQKLAKIVESPKMWITVVMDEQGNITGYLVAQNCVNLPISDHVWILYSFSPKNVESNKEVKEVLKDWTRECGTKEIKFLTKNVQAHKFYGCKETGRVEMVIEV